MKGRMSMFSMKYFTYGNPVFDVDAGLVLLEGWNCLTDDIAAQTHLNWTLD